MHAHDILRRTIDRAAGGGQTSGRVPSSAVRRRRPQTFLFKSDGKVPNNPVLPLVCYRKAIRLNLGADPAALFEALFAQNGWVNSWRDGIYNFAHYHSAAHEVLGIARGRARVRFGGENGKILMLSSEDVVVLPAGTCHQCLWSNAELLVVGAYPPDSDYDESRPSVQNCARAMTTIAHAPAPPGDPIYGASGPLLDLWDL